MHEFDIINIFFKPLALDLTDDAALISCPAGEQMVLSTDTLIADTHFPREAKPSQIARRSLRTCLSDLAAMGAHPIGYLMSLSLPLGTSPEWLQDFCEGLRVDQEHYHIQLLGGDLVTAPHDLSITMTVVGQCRRAWRRSTACADDLIYVTGTIGDAYLGLKVLQGQFPWLDKEHKDYLINRYYLPEPRFMKSDLITAAIDISDGFLQDLGHLCVESNLSAQIKIEDIPLSKAAQAVLASKEVDVLDLLAGGDDYELLLAVSTKIPGITQIGDFSLPSAHRVHLVDASGQPVPFTKTGYEHEI